jgi:serine/threonine protein phosphatase PrpC
MEDVHVALDAPPSAAAFYGVYDGHGGARAAQIAGTFLHWAFFAAPDFAQGRLEDAFLCAFARTDGEILNRALREGGWTDGTTAACVACRGAAACAACAGDAEAVLAWKTPADGLCAACLTHKHNLLDGAEKARVEAAGARAVNFRVNGILAVTRALGDLDYKTPRNGAPSDFVSAAPFTQSFTLTPENPFFIVACDGLWDVVPYGEAARLCDEMREMGRTPEQAARALVYRALALGSADNVTCVVVYVNW